MASLHLFAHSYIILPRFCSGRYTCLLNAINQCFFAAAAVYKIVWASRVEWPFSFTQCYYWENCYKSEVLCWGDYSSTDFSFNFDLLALLTFVVVAVWGCYWSNSVSIPGACIRVKLWRYVFIPFSQLCVMTILHYFFCQVSYMTGKLLLKLESVKFIIASHSVKSSQ